jgi:hypothetical protein
MVPEESLFLEHMAFKYVKHEIRKRMNNEPDFGGVVLPFYLERPL